YRYPAPTPRGACLAAGRVRTYSVCGTYATSEMVVCGASRTRGWRAARPSDGMRQGRACETGRNGAAGLCWPGNRAPGTGSPSHDATPLLAVPRRDAPRPGRPLLAPMPGSAFPSEGAPSGKPGAADEQG